MNPLTRISPKNIELAIIGGGYLGGFVGELGRKYYRSLYACVASSRTRPSLERSHIEVRVGDVFRREARVLPQSSDAEFDAIFMIPPSAIPESEERFADLVKRLARANCRHALLISSTGVYNVEDGATVTAETGTGDASGRALKLKRIEEQWLAGGANFSVLRLAGIYGPERIIGLNSLRMGKPVGGKADAWLNLVHVEDAAALSLHCLGVAANSIELGADGNPVTRGEYYQFIATLLDLPRPQFGGSSTRNTRSKRCDPRTTFERLGFHPKFDNYALGVRASLKLSAE
ncbi:MAG: hypothetical protein ACU84Q_15500 [Gammaproteobacteria bacterium]